MASDPVPPSHDLLSLFSSSLPSPTAPRAIVIVVSGKQLVVSTTADAASEDAAADFASVPELVRERKDTPQYVLYRLNDKQANGHWQWLFYAYTPDNVKIREKIVFNASRIPLINQLGEFHFVRVLFASEPSDFTLPKIESRRHAYQNPLGSEKKVLPSSFKSSGNRAGSDSSTVRNNTTQELNVAPVAAPAPVPTPAVATAPVALAPPPEPAREPSPSPEPAPPAAPEPPVQESHPESSPEPESITVSNEEKEKPVVAESEAPVSSPATEVKAEDPVVLAEDGHEVKPVQQPEEMEDEPTATTEVADAGAVDAGSDQAPVVEKSHEEEPVSRPVPVQAEQTPVHHSSSIGSKTAKEEEQTNSNSSALPPPKRTSPLTSSAHTVNTPLSALPHSSLAVSTNPSNSTESASLLTEKERHLADVRASENSARYGNGGGLGGLLGSGGSEGHGLVSGVGFPWDDGVEEALRALGEGSEEANLVVLSIDLEHELIQLACPPWNISPPELAQSLPPNEPRYAFYRYEHEWEGAHERPIVHLYSCPGSSSVKERMIYSSTAQPFLAAVVKIFTIAKKIETSDPADLTPAFLDSEIHPRTATSAEEPAVKASFSRPKRPGKR